MNDNNVAIAAQSRGASPLYQSYKARVEADGGTLALTQAQLQKYYGITQRAIWSWVAAGRKAGRAHTIQPNDSPSDILLSRNSKATRINSQGKLVECVAHEPAFDFNPFTGEFEGCNFAPQSTNRVNKAIGGYTSTNVVLENYAWPHSTLYTQAFYYGDNSVERYANPVVLFSNTGDTIVSCFVEMADHSEPRLGSGLNTDMSLYIGGAPIEQRPVYTYLKKQISATVWYISGMIPAYNGPSTNNFLRKNSIHSAKPFRMIGYMFEFGATIPGRHIVSTGTVSTKLYDDAVTPMILPINNVVLYADITNNYVMGSGATPRGFSVRLDNINYITVGFTPTGFIGMALIQNGSVVMQINSPVTKGKVCARFVNEEFCLVVNGVAYTNFVTGNQLVSNVLTTSTTVNIGDAARNINVKAVAVMPKMTVLEMISITG